MALERDRRLILVGDQAEAAEVAASEQTDAGRLLDDLVLVGNGDGEGSGIVHPGGPLVHVIAMETDPPALVGLRDVSAERLRHDLVPEADADELRPPLGLPQPLDEAHDPGQAIIRSEEHTSELQSLMRISYAVFCLK